jgi:2-methylcitrate dehydratase PrpD
MRRAENRAAEDGPYGTCPEGPGPVESLESLGRFVAAFDPANYPGLREPLVRTLLDTLGVTVAGARTPEARALVAAWDPPPGAARIFGAGRRTVSETAAYLNGVSAVTLELDEGNKFARGHPASHIFPAALAVAQARNAAGPELAAALLAGYEVASRFGRATRLRAGVHPHGNWGTAGAAAAVARLAGLDASGVAAALDVACATVLATPFEAALVGNAARNGWVGASNVSGIAAARMAAAGIAGNDGLVGATLGGILGEFDPGELTDGLGERFDIELGYFKRHASCSYTHPPADAALEILGENPELDHELVQEVIVETHGVAAPLNHTDCSTRLAAMFSIPYVMGVALVTGGCGPEAFGESRRADPAVRRLVGVTRVIGTEEFDRRLPEERAARVALKLRDGATLVAEVPNPVGDVAHHPFGLREIRDKLDGLLEGGAGEKLEALARNLLECKNVNDVLGDLPPGGGSL